MYSHCARCRRPVRTPVIVDGKGYGPTCATKVGDLLVQPQRRAQAASPKRARRGDERQLQLEVQP